MPSFSAIGKSNGPNSTITGIPSSTLPRTTNATIDTARNVYLPPGSTAIADASCCEKPDCVSAHAMAVAAPRISRMTPESDAVSTSIGTIRDQLN